MGDPLAAQVESAVQNVEQLVPLAAAAPPSEALPGVELADLDLIIQRHRRLGANEGYEEGMRHGRSHGRFEAQMVSTRRLTAAATVIANYLGDTVDRLLQEVLMERAEDGKRDRRTRREVWDEAASVLMRVREAQVLLQDLAVAMERER